MGTSPKDIYRKIHFYQVEWVKRGSRDVIQKDLRFIDGILGRCSGRLFQTSRGGAYVFLGKAGSKNDRSFWKLSMIRQTDLPLKFDTASLSEAPLDLLENEGLSEPSHFVIFDGRIIGAEYNYYGARWIHTKLQDIINEYLRNTQNIDVERVEIKPIFKTGLYELLDKIVELRGIYIKIATNYAKALMRDNPESFGRMFSVAEEFGGVWLYLGFSLGVGRRRFFESSLKRRILEMLKNIFRRNDWQGMIEKLEITALFEDQEATQTIDLIEKLLVAEKKVMRLNEKSRAVDSESMFNAIQESYESFKDIFKEYISPP